MGDARRSNMGSPQYRGPVPEYMVGGSELSVREVPTAEWVERERAAKGERAAIPPRDDERDLVVFLRVSYAIPSELIPAAQWPSVSTDLCELGRLNMAVLKRRVKEALEKAGETGSAA